MDFPAKIKGKSQTEKLVKHFMGGGGVNFITAFVLFKIQDLHKRLQEVRDLGYNLRTTKERSEMHPNTKLTTWYMVDVLIRGDYVKIEKAPIFSPFNTHPLKGAVGIIKRFNRHTHEYSVAHAKSGAVFGRFKHRELKRIAKFAQDELVVFRHGVFEVKAFNHAQGFFILKDANKKNTEPILAESTLLEHLNYVDAKRNTRPHYCYAN